MFRTPARTFKGVFLEATNSHGRILSVWHTATDSNTAHGADDSQAGRRQAAEVNQTAAGLADLIGSYRRVSHTIMDENNMTMMANVPSTTPALPQTCAWTKKLTHRQMTAFRDLLQVCVCSRMCPLKYTNYPWCVCVQGHVFASMGFVCTAPPVSLLSELHVFVTSQCQISECVPLIQSIPHTCMCFFADQERARQSKGVRMRSRVSSGLQYLMLQPQHTLCLRQLQSMLASTTLSDCLFCCC